MAQQNDVSRVAPAATVAGGNGSMAGISAETARAVAQVQGQVSMAKAYPRDQNAAWARIMQACRRKSLAEQAAYAYPRGDATVTGPSIRLAETLAQCWGNLDFGIIELSQDSERHESQVCAYAWDLETNVRQTKTFSQPHIRSKRSGNETLRDPRDIYELVANSGARRLRACILGIIPGDIVEAAAGECEKTLAGDASEPLADRIRAMVAAFADVGVSQEMLGTRLGHAVDAATSAELSGLRKIFHAIKDGMADRGQYFSIPADQRRKGAEADAVNAALANASKPATPKPEPMIKVEATGPNGKLAAPATAAGKPETITPEQAQRIYAMAAGRGWSEADVKISLARRGWESALEIPAGEYEAILIATANARRGKAHKEAAAKVAPPPPVIEPEVPSEVLAPGLTDDEWDDVADEVKP